MIGFSKNLPNLNKEFSHKGKILMYLLFSFVSVYKIQCDLLTLIMFS